MNPNATNDAAASAGPHASGQRTLGGLEVGLATDPGRDPNKQVNEDSAFARETAHGFLAVVCDGMGGHVGGKEASSLAIETIFHVFDATPAGSVPPGQLLGDAIRHANHAIHDRGQTIPELKGMGSTCVAILTHAGGTEVAHVGDSRVYLLTQGQVYQVTKDHSLVQRLVDANMLTPEEASNHPSANQITNALGMRPDVEVEVRPQPFAPQPGDTFVLCSDGLSDECGPQDILGVLAPFPPCEVAGRQLVDLANARGGHDNITVVVVRFPGGAAFAGPGGGGVHTPVAMPVAPPMATMEMSTISPNAAPPSAHGAISTHPVAPQSIPAQAAAVAVASPGYASTPTPIEPSRKKGGGVLVAIVIVVLLVGAAAAATLYYRARQQEAQSQGTPAIEPSMHPDEGGKTLKSVKPKGPDPVNVPEPEPEPQPEPQPSPSPSPSPSFKPRPPQGEPTPKPKLPPDTVKTPPSATEPHPDFKKSGHVSPAHPRRRSSRMSDPRSADPVPALKAKSE